MRNELAISLFACAAIGLAACQEGPLTTTVVIGLSAVPERVASISVSVRELDGGRLVASATATRDRTHFELGLPAEVPLEITAIARSDRPGPLGGGARNPAYVGRARRTLRLLRERQSITLLAVPAGVLTVLPDDKREEAVSVRFQGEREEDTPVDVALPEASLAAVPLVLAAGGYNVEIPLAEGDSPEDLPLLVGGDGIYVARELESVSALWVRPQPPELEPDAPRALIAGLTDGTGRNLSLTPGVATATSGDASFGVTVTAVDQGGRPVLVPDVPVTIDVRTFPPELLRTAPLHTRPGLPLTFTGLKLRGTGRVEISVHAELEDERRLTAALSFNALRPGDVPGPPFALALELEDRALLVEGTRLELRVLDRAGLLSPVAKSQIDLTGSDPWAYFPDGPTLALEGPARALARHRLARPSGPRDAPVTIRAVLTATAVPQALTATLTLPLLR